MENGWTDDDLLTIDKHRDLVVDYLRKRVLDASDPKQEKNMKRCRDIFRDVDMFGVYKRTRKHIHSVEPSAKEAMNAMKRLPPAIKCPRNPSGLVELYNSGRAVYPHFHAFIAQAAKASGSAYVYKSHGRQPGMKVHMVYIWFIYGLYMVYIWFIWFCRLN